MNVCTTMNFFSLHDLQCKSRFSFFHLPLLICALNQINKNAYYSQEANNAECVMVVMMKKMMTRYISHSQSTQSSQKKVNMQSFYRLYPRLI